MTLVFLFLLVIVNYDSHDDLKQFATHRIAWHNLSTGCRLNLSTQQNAWGNRFLFKVQCRWQHWYTLMFFISPDAACTSMSLVCSWTATAFIKTSMRIIENLLENCVRSCLFLKFHFSSYKYWLKVWENVSVIFTHVRVDCTNPGGERVNTLDLDIVSVSLCACCSDSYCK